MLKVSYVLINNYSFLKSLTKFLFLNNILMKEKSIKMKKKLLIIFINTALIALFLFLIEVGIWAWENESLKQRNDSYRALGLLKFHPGIKPAEIKLEYFPNPDENWGRAPEGTNFKGKPIVFFGCSYTYGLNLKPEETLPYKIAYLTKRPTYNRAYPAWGIQHMLYQAQSEKLYEKVPEPEYVIYMQMHDHFRRLYLITYTSGHMLNEDLNIRYKEKNNNLTLIRNTNPFLLFIKRLYITNKIHQLYVDKFILNEKNREKYQNFAIKHYVKSKEEMQKHWKNAKFVIIMYDDYKSDESYIENLEAAGFEVITYKDLTDKDLTSAQYMSKDYHPTANAWDLLTPKIVEKLGL